jgi:hypothetical protein
MRSHTQTHTHKEFQECKLTNSTSPGKKDNLTSKRNFFENIFLYASIAAVKHIVTVLGRLPNLKNISVK